MIQKLFLHNKYNRHAILAFYESIAYRANYFINLISGVVFFLVIYQIWSAIFSENASVSKFTWKDMKGYLLVSLFIGAFITGLSEVRISRQVRTGNIVFDILRPVDFLKSVLFITLGNSITEGILVIFALVVCIFLVGPFSLPSDFQTWILFLTSMTLAYLIKFLLIYLFGLLCFWTVSYLGINWLRKAATDFFSGAIIPISMFPEYLRIAGDFLPFRGIVFIPAGIFIGQLKGINALLDISFQLFWVVVLLVIARLSWNLLLKKLDVQGG